MTPLSIQCDTCGHPAPSLDEIREQGKGGGLIALGWYCAGGKRVCEKCAPEQREAAV